MNPDDTVPSKDELRAMTGAQLLATSIRPEERRGMIIAGKDPEQYVALDLPVRAIRPTQIGRGALTMVAEILVPSSLFAGFDKPKVIVRIDGKPDVPDLELGTLPSVRLVLKQSGLSEGARSEMEQSLRFQNEQGPVSEPRG